MIELSELKAHLGADQVKTDPDRDTVLAGFEAAAVAFVEGETGRHFGAAAAFTEYLDGSGSVELRLNEKPTSLTSVHERLDAADAWTEILTASTNGWELQGLAVLRKGGCWERGTSYRVIYSFGYAAGSEPAEIRMLVIDLVKMRWRQRGVEGHASGRIGDYGFTLSDIEAIPGATEILDRWRWCRVSA